MKDSLEYSDIELEALSTSELEELIQYSDNQQSLLNTSQLVQKLLINSLYGCLANKHFALFNEHMARAITGNGRYFIQLMGREIEHGLQNMIKSDKPYVIYKDTDSNYFNVDKFVDKAFADSVFENSKDELTKKTDFCDNFYEKVVDKFVQLSIDKFGKELNAYNVDVIGSEREIIADKSIWTAKKKYIARVIDSEGVRFDEPEVKVMGLDIIRSGTPSFVKKKLKESITLLLDNNEESIKKWKDEVKIEFSKQSLFNISKIQGVSNIDYETGQKGIPIGARSVIVHNEYILEHELENEIQTIQAGEKIHQLYLKLPNKFNSNIIGWNNDKFQKYIIKEDCVDFNLCFEKYFLAPLELMTKALKYNVRKSTASLDDW